MMCLFNGDDDSTFNDAVCVWKSAGRPIDESIDGSKWMWFRDASHCSIDDNVSISGPLYLLSIDDFLGSQFLPTKFL